MSIIDEARRSINEVEGALENAEKELFEYLCSKRSHLRRKPTEAADPTTANLCEAYLDEWYTLGVLRAGAARKAGQ